MFALAAGAMILLLMPSGLKTRNRMSLLLCLLSILFFGALAAYQVNRQLFAYKDPRFIRFYQQYNKRDNTNAPKVIRGAILDRRGRVLVAPDLTDEWKRRSILGEAAAHPIGYRSRRFGMTGIERVLDTPLSSVRNRPPAGTDTVEADPVQVSLDSRLQGFAYDVLAGRKGAAIVLIPQTGEILAMASSPGFDPSDPSTALRDTENTPALNRALQGLYPPASTFKLLIAALAIDSGLNPVFNCPGSGYLINERTPPIRDSEYYASERSGTVWGGWGRLNMTDALVHSSNVYFAQLGIRLGAKMFTDCTQKLFVPYTVLESGDLSLGTVAPKIPDYTKGPRRLAFAAIGQDDILVTPLHIALLTGAIANNGLLVQPTLAFPHVPAPQPIFKPATAIRLADMMRETVIRGTARGVEIPGLSVCGKTGTAEAGGGDDHSWFTCFAPKKNPRIVVTVLIERGGFGSAAAVPAAREILLEARRLKYLP